MRVFFLINKFLNSKTSGKSKDILSLNSSLKKKGLVKLRRKNFKKFSSILVYSGNFLRRHVRMNKKLLSIHYKNKQLSGIKFQNLINKFGSKKFSFNVSSFYTNALYNNSEYVFLNRKLTPITYYTSYFKDVLNLQVNGENILGYSLLNEDFNLNKSDFCFLNNFSYSLEKNELNFLYNNNLYENESNDFFFKKINFFNLKNIIMDIPMPSNSKDGSYLKKLEENSFFFNSLFERRVFFEKREFFNFYKKQNFYNTVFYKNYSYDFFNFKNKLISFNFNQDFIYKYLKGRGKKFYISYYNKLNLFFLNLKKNELLYKKVSKKLFLKKYNMLKLYVNELIGRSLNKNSLLGFIFKSNFVIQNTQVNSLFSLNEKSLFFNSIYSNKKQFLGLIDEKNSNFYIKFKNYISFSFYQQLASVNNFLIFFVSSINFIRHIPLLNDLIRDIYYVYTYINMFRMKQILEYSNFNSLFYFNSNNLSISSSMVNNSSFLNFNKNYIPFFYDFIFKNDFSFSFKNFFILGKKFKNNILFQKKIRTNTNDLLNKNYLAINDDLFVTNYKYFYSYLTFFNSIIFLLKKSKKIKNLNLNIYWLSLAYNY